MGWLSRWRRRRVNPQSELGPHAGERPIVLALEPTDAEIRAAVGRWIELMACGDYAAAVAAVFRNPPAPEKFQEQVETFCTGLAAARQAIVGQFREQGFQVDETGPPAPDEPRQTKVVPAWAKLLEAMEIHRDGIPPNAAAWLGFHVPLDNGFGIWTTMGVLRAGDQCVLEFEILHL